MIQNLWDTAKAVLRGTFIAIQPYLRKQEKSVKHKNLLNHLNNITCPLYLKQLEKEQTKPNVISRREIIKIKAEVNEI